MNDITRKVIDNLARINAIPRCSKKEEKIARWFVDWAAEHRYQTHRDKAGNLCIKVPATAGHENAPTIILQGHMDMVCEKTPDSRHDFDHDPIRLVRNGEWISADRTTLGADNGIALALALTLAEEPAVVHPPLELLFTVDEESGLLGAKNLDPGLVDGRILLNIDSEEEGVFTIGCAGGQETRLRLNLQRTAEASDHHHYDLTISGLRGGHSGIDIHKPRASANVLMTRVLQAISSVMPIGIVSLKGGTVHNAIARDAVARIHCASQKSAVVQQVLAECRKIFSNEYGASEPKFELRLNEAATETAGGGALSAADTRKAIALLLALPHGVMRMSADIEGLVETSNNLATVTLSGASFEILSSQRSAVMTRLAEITARIHAVADLAGVAATDENSYPAWEPNLDSALLHRCKAVYRDRFGRDPGVQTIHAGLECGLIGARKPGMDMISFGPTIENPHSPDEKLYVPSVARVWDFIVHLFASYTV
ncbi:MAG: aminoacyl-histidine dipeptidase [Desulfobacterales bacterium]|jgi:dipeptidase D